MDIDRLLNEIFIAAFNEAKAENHEYITPESVTATVCLMPHEIR